MKKQFVIKKARYITSAVQKNQFLNKHIEVAFVGRSNVGKSSLINCLVNQKKLAKTSSTAGLTKMINYFLINDEIYFVDLPGYGYSKTGKKHQKLWSILIEDYLTFSNKLKMVFLLVDIRHKPSNLDVLMQKFLFYNNIPYKIVATKYDKIAKTKVNTFLKLIADNLNVTIKNIIPFSSNNKFGKDILLNIIGEINE